MFDQSLSNGLEISLEERFQSFERKNGIISIKTNKRKFNTDLLIGSDGPSSRVRSQEFDYNMKHYKGYQVRIKADLDSNNLVEVHIQRPFFTWIVPEGDGIFRIGTISDSPKESLYRFLEERGIKNAPIEIQSGVIPIGKGLIIGIGYFIGGCSMSS